MSDTSPRAARALLDPLADLDDGDLPALDDGPTPASTAAEELAPVAPSNALDLLRADLATDVKATRVTLPVPGRPHLSVRYVCDVDGDELVTWRKRATNRQRNTIDEIKLAALTLAFKCEAILRDGVEVTDGGEPVTFRSPLILEMTGEASAVAAIRRFYGLDGHVAAAGNRVLAESGFGDELVEEDDPANPTKTSR